MPRGTSTDADHLRKWLEEGVLLKADRVEGSVDLDDEDLVHVAIVVNVTSIGPHVGAMYVDQNRYHASADTSLQEAFEILQQWELDNNQDYFAELEQEYGDEAFDVFTETFDGLTWKLSPREFADAVAGTRADGLVDIRGGEEGGVEEARGPRAKETNIVQWDVDEAESLCSLDGEDCVYWLTAQGSDGWYVTIVIDSETGHFTSDLATDDGPYKSEAEAYMGGMNGALQWMSDNEVRYSSRDWKKIEQTYERLKGPTQRTPRPSPRRRR